MNAIMREFPTKMFWQRNRGARCAAIVRTYASPSRVRRTDKTSTKDRTSEVPPPASKTSGELPKTKGERKELPYLSPASSISRQQAHAMVLYKDGEADALCVHTVP